jgi:hypothetical protein
LALVFLLHRQQVPESEAALEERAGAHKENHTKSI